MQLDGYYFETVTDRKYYCVEKATQFLPTVTIQILNFVAMNTSINQNSIDPVEINNIFQNLKITLKKFVTQCGLRDQNWKLTKRLKRLKLYFSGNETKNFSFQNQLITARDFPNQIVEVIRTYKKNVYSLNDKNMEPASL